MITFPSGGLAKPPAGKCQTFPHICPNRQAGLVFTWGNLLPHESEERMESIGGFQADRLQLLFPWGIPLIHHRLPQAVSASNKAPDTHYIPGAVLRGDAESKAFPGGL